MTPPPGEYAHPSSRSTVVGRSVGARIRLRRTQLALTQEDLAVHLGLTFQQVQKYENGTHHMGASCLFGLAQVLNVGVEYFFEDMSSPFGCDAILFQLSDTPVLPASAPGLRRDILDLVYAYYRIKTPEARRQVLDLARSLTALSP